MTTTRELFSGWLAQNTAGPKPTNIYQDEIKRLGAEQAAERARLYDCISDKSAEAWADTRKEHERQEKRQRAIEALEQLLTIN